VTQGGSNSAAGVREGDVLAGKYRVERVLGVGGMGVVVAAHHLQLNSKVALKFLLPDALHDSEAVARFAREAQAAVKIQSEHVARVTDVGTLPNGAPYMVMEYLEGEDLAAWIARRGPLPVEQAVEFVLHACVAVADAHALGIVHRDLKPANLFCVRRSDGQLSIKVLDFGISKMTGSSGSPMGSVTRTSALMGSPLYMSPEQMRSSKDVDAQTDIWALGVILFELVSGRPAFLADSVTELAIKVANEPTPAIRSLRPDVAEGLEAVVAKCLEKDRRQRYRNVAELALALLPLAPKRAKASVDRIAGIIHAAGLSASAFAAPSSPPMAATVAAPGTIGPVGRTTVESSGRKTAVLGAGLAGAVVVVAVVGSAISWPRPAPSHAPTEPVPSTRPAESTTAPSAAIGALASPGLPDAVAPDALTEPIVKKDEPPRRETPSRPRPTVHGAPPLTAKSEPQPPPQPTRTSAAPGPQTPAPNTDPLDGRR
jgi:serine/threonine protein kinase